jgi:hypothetical protein
VQTAVFIGPTPQLNCPKGICIKLYILNPAFYEEFWRKDGVIGSIHNYTFANTVKLTELNLRFLVPLK